MAAEHWLLVVALCLTAVSVTGRVYWTDVQVSNVQKPKYYTLMERSFGFQQGGELHFSLACPARVPIDVGFILIKFKDQNLAKKTN